MNIARSGGVAVGIMFGLLLCIILFKVANRNHKLQTEYDERQKEVRGRAYQYAFYTIAFYEVAMMIMSMGEFSLPVEEPILHFGGIILSALVLAVYSIRNGAYWGLNNNHRRYAIILLVAGILNAIPVVNSLVHGGMVEDGKLSFPFLNLLVLIVLLVLGAALLMEHAAEKREAEEV